MVLRKVLLSWVLSIVIYSCADNQQGSELVVPQETPVQKASSLFTQHCSVCHGEDGKLGASGAKDLTQSRLSAQEIEKIIRLGKNAMPPMQSLLGSDEHITLVVDHVKKMQK
jgi:mono/diheme cytochrome c family protein